MLRSPYTTVSSSYTQNLSNPRVPLKDIRKDQVGSEPLDEYSASPFEKEQRCDATGTRGQDYREERERAKEEREKERKPGEGKGREE